MAATIQLVVLALRQIRLQALEDEAARKGSNDRHLFAQLASSRDLECTNGGVPVLVARGAGVQSADLQITGAVEEGHPLTDHDEIYAMRR